MRACDPISLQKAILWEQAKGLLRAIYAAEGAAQSKFPVPENKFPFEAIEAAVETFIKSFEDEGHHE